MVIKKGKGLKEPVTLFDVINALILILITLVCIIPIIHVVAASFSDPIKLAQHEGILFVPLGFYTRGYEMVFKDPAIITGYLNTILYVVTATALNILMTLLGGYVVSRRRCLFASPIMFLMTFTMFFSGGLIPFYLTVNNLGLINSFWSMILPVAVSAYNVIIMRTSMMGIPYEMEESAKIDGANDIVILFRIMVPLVTPVIAVLVLFYAVGHWNSWFNAMLFLRERSKYPLQLILREILLAGDTNSMAAAAKPSAIESLDQYVVLLNYCTIVVATAPILCIYPFIQKYFVKGVMIGSIKG